MRKHPGDFCFALALPCVSSRRASRKQVAITLPVEAGLTARELVALGCRAEEEGFDYVVCGEVAGVDALVLLGAIAAKTSRVKIATGIIASTIRTPQLAAMGFATLGSLAPGRVTAGIGASSPIIVQQWHGLPFSKPLTATREFVEVFRSALRQEKVYFDGECVKSNGFLLQVNPQGPIPVWLGAINDKMLHLAGGAADGVFLTWCPPAEIPERMAVVTAGAVEAGRNPDDVEVVCSFWAYAGPDTSAAMETARRVVLQYAMVPTHQHAFVQSFPSLAAAAEAWNSNDRKKALSLLDDSVVQTMCAIGTAEQVADRVSAYHDNGVDVAIILPIATRQGAGDVAANTYFSVAGEMRRRGLIKGSSSRESGTLWK